MTLLLGSNWVIVKQPAASLDPFTFAALRFGLAALLFSPWLPKGLMTPPIGRAGLELGAWSALGYLTQAWALQYTPASRASLLSTFTVLLVPMFAGLSGQRVPKLVWGAASAALLGTFLLEGGGGSPPNAGDAVAVVSAAFFAAQLFRTERLSRSLPNGSALPLMATTLATVAAAAAAAASGRGAGGAAAALGSLVDAAAHGGSAAAVSALQQLCYTAWCSTDLALLIEVLALQDVSSTEAAMIYSLEPVSGAAIAYALLGERWGPLGWVGSGIIVVAAVVAQLKGGSDGGGGGDSDGGGGGGGREDAGAAARAAAAAAAAAQVAAVLPVPAGVGSRRS